MRLRTLGLGVAGFVGGLAALNRRLEKVGEPARLAGGEERRYYWRGWRLSDRVAGEAGAPPVLLVHGVYAGASSYEFRKNYLALAEDFRVYALISWVVVSRSGRGGGTGPRTSRHKSRTSRGRRSGCRRT